MSGSGNRLSIDDILSQMRGQDCETMANFDEFEDYEREEKIRSLSGKKIA